MTGRLPAVVLLAGTFLGACARDAVDWTPTAVSDQPVEPEFAGAVAVPDRVATRSEPWDFDGTTGSIIHTPHYRIHTTSSSPRVLDRVPLFIERALVHYRTSLTPDEALPPPPSALETYLFATREQWLSHTRRILPHQADAFRSLGRGGYTTRGISVLYYIGYRDTMAIAAHEGWHQYTQRTFRDPLPVWLEEGVATWMEGHRGADSLAEFLPWRNWERWSALRSAVRDDDLIRLDDLLRGTPQSFLLDSKESLLVYYAQVWCLVRFLVDGEGGRYRESLETVLLDAANGRLRERTSRSPQVLSRGGRSEARAGVSGPWVIIAHFNDDLAAFEREYLTYARALVSGRLYSG